MCVHCTNTCPRHQPLWPATCSSASLTHGQAYHKTSSMKQLVNGESDYVQAWGKRTSLKISAKLKTGTFQSQRTIQPALSEPPAVYCRGKHVVSRHFHRSNLKANKVSKSKGTRKVKYAYHFWKCADDVDRKLSKLVHPCRSYSLPKRSFETQCIFNLYVSADVTKILFDRKL